VLPPPSFATHDRFGVAVGPFASAAEAPITPFASACWRVVETGCLPAEGADGTGSHGQSRGAWPLAPIGDGGRPEAGAGGGVWWVHRFALEKGGEGARRPQSEGA